MDLLSSYDDETSNNNDQNPSRPVTNSGHLQSEWESFEKSIEQSSPVHSSTGPATDSSHSEMRKSSSSDDSQLDGEVKTEQSQMEKDSATTEKRDEEEDEDESHLPPGVRKKNRCHNSSSSSSEDEAPKKEGKGHSDSDMSDSDDSGTAPNHAKVTATKVEKKEEEKQKPKVEKEEGASSKKARRSRSSSGSRSRSRSRSPRRKRRKSSEKSRHSRSRSRGRHHRKERKHGSSRHSRSRDRRRSKDRDHRHRHRESRHSRSHSRERRNSQRDRRRSRDRTHRSSRDKRSRSPRDKRSRSPRDKRSRSPSPRGARVIKYGDKVIKAGASFGRPPPAKPMTFKEKMRQQLIKAMEEGGDVSQALTSDDGKVICTQTAGTQQNTAPKKAPVPLMSNLVTSTAGLTAATITASEAAMQSMLALQKETTEKTGVEIPKYYNPAAINPVKYAEQVQKRKLLWSKTKEKDVNSQWHATTLSSEHDDKSKEKFRKLMGIKQETAGSGTGDNEEKVHEEQELKQRELFDKLDKEYQFARMATHTHRGIGLGFGSSSSYQPPST